MSRRTSNQLIKMLCRLGRSASPQITLCKGRVLGQQITTRLGSTQSINIENLNRLCQSVCRRGQPASFPLGTHYPVVPSRCYYSTQIRLKEKQDTEASDTTVEKPSTKVDVEKDTVPTEGNSKHRESSSVSQNSDEDLSQTSSENLTLLKRFKIAYKEYGKVLIAVHISTSLVWYSTFVYAASVGVDVVPLLEWIGAGETITRPFKSSGLGNLAVGYLMYKLATPARYTVTLGGTQMAVRYLRKTGYMEPVKEEDRLKNLMKEGSEKFKDKRGELKDKYEDWRDDMKEKIKDKAKELQDSPDNQKKDT